MKGMVGYRVGLVVVGIGGMVNEVGEKEMEKQMEVGVVNVGKVGMGGEE